MRYSARRAGSRRYGGRAAARPSRAWADVSGAWNLNNVTGTTAVKLIELQAPASLVNLTSDPPEDLTILRMRGSFYFSLSTGMSEWTLALTVQDTDWTPGATAAVDADKRLLWSQVYRAPLGVQYMWTPPGLLTVDPLGAGQVVYAGEAACHLDISPKVKVEAGKALYLVAYEEYGTAFAVSGSRLMRVLFQRSGRPR